MKLLWLIVIVMPAVFYQALLATIGEVTITAKVVTHSPSPTPTPPSGGGGGGYSYFPISTPTPIPGATPTSTPARTPSTLVTPASLGFTTLAALGLKEGDTISAINSDDPDVYIVNDWGYKRLFLNPVIFNFYGHLGGFSNVKRVPVSTRDILVTSGLFRNCEANDPKVYGVETTSEDTGTLHWVNTTGAQAVADEPEFFKKVFCINNNEFNWYPKGTAYTSASQIHSYSRQVYVYAPALALIKVVSWTPYLNVRDAPSLAGTVIGRLIPNELVSYIQVSNGWYQIILSNDASGWVSGNYVTVVQ